MPRSCPAGRLGSRVNMQAEVDLVNGLHLAFSTPLLGPAACEAVVGSAAAFVEQSNRWRKVRNKQLAR